MDERRPDPSVFPADILVCPFRGWRFQVKPGRFKEADANLLPSFLRRDSEGHMVGCMKKFSLPEFIGKILWPFAAVILYVLALLLGALCVGRLGDIIGTVCYGADFDSAFLAMADVPAVITYFEMIQGAIIAIILLSRVVIYRSSLGRIALLAVAGTAMLLLLQVARRMTLWIMDHDSGMLPWWTLLVVDIGTILTSGWTLFYCSNRILKMRGAFWTRLVGSAAVWIDGGALLLLIQLRAPNKTCHLS